MSKANLRYAKHSPRLLNLFNGKITPTIPKGQYQTPEKKRNQKTFLKSVLNDIWKSKVHRNEGKPNQRVVHKKEGSWKRYANKVDLTKETSSFTKYERKRKMNKVERLRSIEERYKKFEESYCNLHPDGKKSCISKFTLEEETTKFKKNQRMFAIQKERPVRSYLGKRSRFPKKKRVNKWKQRKLQKKSMQGLDHSWNSLTSRNTNYGKMSVDGAFYKKKLKTNNLSFNSQDYFENKQRYLLNKLEESLKELKDSTPEKYKIGSDLELFESEEERIEKEQRCFTAYSARTNKGLYRDYNEDRVSIIVNILLDVSKSKTQSSSFFALFDGHAGDKCADFLKDNLHYFVTNQKEFVNDKKTAMRKGIFKAEEEFWKLAQIGPKLDISGSCLLLSLFQGNTCYFANVGDSRTMVSENKGKKVFQLTTDHKPENEIETRRIKENGGDVFRNKKTYNRRVRDPVSGKHKSVEVVKYGPHRVNPGGLSVSRTIGDIPSKDPRLGGAQSCVIPTPEIGEYPVKQNSDFMVLACDGIYDVLSNEEVSNAVWESIERYVKFMDLEEVSRMAAENVMKASFDKRSMDNVTVIVILFRDKKYYLKGRKEQVFF